MVGIELFVGIFICVSVNKGIWLKFVFSYNIVVVVYFIYLSNL